MGASKGMEMGFVNAKALGRRRNIQASRPEALRAGHRKPADFVRIQRRNSAILHFARRPGIGSLPCTALAEKDALVTVAQTLELAAAAMAAGAMNAVAGGGTLVTFPTLILVGTGSEVANATSTLALVIGTGGSIYGYREHAKAIMPWLARFWLVSAVGGFLGGVLLTHTSDAFFSKMVPFLILFATILFMAQDAFRRLAKKKSESTQKPAFWGAIIFQFAVAVYGGFFGAGIGILMLASLGIMGMKDIHEMNTLKTVLGSLINAVATLWFIHSGLIDWWKAGIMTVGAVIGYYLTARYAQSISQRRVRQLISAIGIGISGFMFYKQFVK